MIVPKDSGAPQDAPPLTLHISLFDGLLASTYAIEYVSELADYIAAGGMPTQGDRDQAHRADIALRAIARELKL